MTLLLQYQTEFDVDFSYTFSDFPTNSVLAFNLECNNFNPHSLKYLNPFDTCTSHECFPQYK